jgi:hypothetical protein
VIRSEGVRLLLGAAPYSLYDLALLDIIDEKLSEGQLATGQPASAVWVDVFSTLACLSHADFGRYVPGLGNVFQTPVVGIWEEGVLRDRAWGARGRDLAAGLFGVKGANAVQRARERSGQPQPASSGR